MKIHLSEPNIGPRIVSFARRLYMLLDGTTTVYQLRLYELSMVGAKEKSPTSEFTISHLKKFYAQFAQPTSIATSRRREDRREE